MVKHNHVPISKSEIGICQLTDRRGKAGSKTPLTVVQGRGLRGKQDRLFFGLARNARLVEEIHVELAQTERRRRRTGKPARRFKDFRYRRLDSWSRRRRVVAKAECGREAKPALSS